MTVASTLLGTSAVALRRHVGAAQRPWKLSGKGQKVLTPMNLGTDPEEKINLLED